MKITQEMLDEAEERAERAMAYLDEDGRWALIRERIEHEQEIQRERAIEAMELEALRKAVCPNVTRKDWSEAMGGRVPLDQWIHRVRAGTRLGDLEGEAVITKLAPSARRGSPGMAG